MDSERRCHWNLNRCHPWLASDKIHSVESIFSLSMTSYVYSLSWFSYDMEHLLKGLLTSVRVEKTHYNCRGRNRWSNHSLGPPLPLHAPIFDLPLHLLSWLWNLSGYGSFHYQESLLIFLIQFFLRAMIRLIY